MDSDIDWNWQRWLQELPMLEQFKVKWRVMPNVCIEGVKLQIHVHTFCDALEEAYGAISYLWVIDVDGEIHCSLLLAKLRPAPRPCPFPGSSCKVQ